MMIRDLLRTRNWARLCPHSPKDPYTQHQEPGKALAFKEDDGTRLSVVFWRWEGDNPADLCFFIGV